MLDSYSFVCQSSVALPIIWSHEFVSVHVAQEVESRLISESIAELRLLYSEEDDTCLAPITLYVFFEALVKHFEKGRSLTTKPQNHVPEVLIVVKL